MAIRDIAARRIFVCDGCGLEKESSSRPAYWTGLNIEAHAYDFQGSACADASFSRVLCQQCTDIVHSAINAAIKERKSAKESE